MGGPKPFFEKITEKGLVLIKFSSKTFVVPDLDIINNGTVSLSRDARELSTTTHPVEVPVIEVKIDPGIESNATALTFRWNVTR